MGVLSDLYLAEPKHAKDYDESQECAEDDKAQYKGITPLELSTLWAILQRKEWNVAMMNEFPEIMVVDEGQRLIFEIPQSAMTCFAALSESESLVAAEAWSKTDELRCQAEDVLPVIDENGHYPNQPSGNHTAIYMGKDSKGRPLVMEQNVGTKDSPNGEYHSRPVSKDEKFYEVNAPQKHDRTPTDSSIKDKK